MAGKYVLVCQNADCKVRGSREIIEALKETARRISRQMQKGGVTGAA